MTRDEKWWATVVATALAGACGATIVYLGDPRAQAESRGMPVEMALAIGLVLVATVAATCHRVGETWSYTRGAGAVCAGGSIAFALWAAEELMHRFEILTRLGSATFWGLLIAQAGVWVVAARIYAAWRSRASIRR